LLGLPLPWQFAIDGTALNGPAVKPLAEVRQGRWSAAPHEQAVLQIEMVAGARNRHYVLFSALGLSPGLGCQAGLD
jgi:hypothetical protein